MENKLKKRLKQVNGKYFSHGHSRKINFDLKVDNYIQCKITPGHGQRLRGTIKENMLDLNRAFPEMSAKKIKNKNNEVLFKSQQDMGLANMNLPF